MVGQVAVSLVLLVAAGLFARALQRAVSIDPGFDPRGVVAAGVYLGPHGYDEERGEELFRRLMDGVRALPGVEAASLASLIPLSGDADMTRVSAAGSGAEPVRTGVAAVDGEWFRTMRIPLASGRTFTAADRDGAPRVVVINETLARRLWPGQNPIGRRIDRGDFEAEVVGVARDARYESLREEQQAYLYFPFAQNYQGQMVLHVRTASAPAATIEAIRRELRALDPDVPLGGAGPLSQTIGAATAPQRIAATLIGLFGVLGLVLAAVGVYGVLAFSVSQRTREIGVRMALGASAASVLRMVVRQGLMLCAVGVGLGLALAFAGTRVLASLLYGVSATDLATFVAVPLLVAAAALLASWLPARRATRVDPITALRAE